ncbi:Oidioi.mRNA.OKI2018_I69.chr1.g3333.t1.cds [Oikopleura dioica]|uniref:Oidioi.mRNA.OKI2018_I69.chr1.g3333.t1.cds n=1 Tax=Oikopleura dioica TaxID=34765 RepID=A0ABN7STM1_OIKDI|nr:Oidioi.mRNA.OKI2018_I69.chr1.g3333.t1.cds [Oikopleura dioica]
MDSQPNGFEFSPPATQSGFGPSIIEVLNHEEGINMKSLGEVAMKGRLGKGWSEDEFLLFADIITDENVFYEEHDGPNMVVGIVKRFLEERPDKTEFQSVWLFHFVRELTCGMEKYAESQSEYDYVNTQHLFARVFDLWRHERKDNIRMELFRAMSTLFDKFFTQNELNLPSKHVEFIKLTMLFQMSDEYLPERSMAKKIVDMILSQEQPAPVQITGFKLLMLLYKEFPKAYLSFQRKFAMMMIIIEGSDEFDYIPIYKYETKKTATKTTEKYFIIQLDTESIDLSDQQVTIYFNRNSTFHGVDTEDVIRREGPFFFTVQKKGRRAPSTITSTNRSSSIPTTAVSPVPACEMKELKSVVDLELLDPEGVSQMSVDLSQPLSQQNIECRSLVPSSFYRSEVVPLNRESAYNLKTPTNSHKMKPTDSHSTLAPLTRGLETQFKLKQTPKNEKKSKNPKEGASSGEEDLPNMTIAAGTPGIMMSAKKVKQEMHLPITPIEAVRSKPKVKDPPPKLTTFAEPTIDTDESSDADETTPGPSVKSAIMNEEATSSQNSKGSRELTPDMPVEFNSSPTDLNMAPPRKKSKTAKALSSSTPLMQKQRPNVSETVTKEQQEMMGKLREKFASISQFMPRVEESIKEIESVKNQVDENCRKHFEQMKKARKDLRKNAKQVIKDSEQNVAAGERKKAIATMAKQLMEKIIVEMRK